MEIFLTATTEAGKRFYQNFNDKGKVVMLNLLKYKKESCYDNLESIKPANQLSGEEAFKLYLDVTLPLLKKAGSRILFYGKCGSFVIGPEQEKWDAVLLVEHESVSKFMQFAQDKEYLKTAGHRTAALDDSRLLPVSECDLESYSEC